MYYLPRRFLLLVLVPAALLLVGTLGYWLLEPEYGPFDALYMTVITLTTVGYGEVHELHTPGRVFTIFLLCGGVFSLFYAASEIIRSVVSGEVQGAVGRRRVEKKLAGLKDHLVICGYGRMGRYICREFSQEGRPFVIIDRAAAALHDFDMAHGIGLVGDATEDEVLRRAGVERARAVIVVAASDSDNLFITLSARLLSPGVFIVARAEGEMAEPKLRRAGADRVVSPYAIGGFRVAQAVLRPNVVDFIELATRTEILDVQIEETQVEAGSRLDGISLSESGVRRDFGVIIVAIKKAAGHMQFNPPGEALMEAGDTLIALGDREHLAQLEQMALRGRG